MYSDSNILCMHVNVVKIIFDEILLWCLNDFITYDRQYIYIYRHNEDGF